jgi:shikimate kinase
VERLQGYNIILIGFMGSGKTSVGKLLAERLGYGFQDTDSLIEIQEQESIGHMFETKGEAYFRDLETMLLRKMQPELTHTILSTGGGLVLREQNRELLRGLGYVFYLKASDETIVDRLKEDKTRPLLQGEDLSAKVERLQKERMPIYLATAHKMIQTDDKTPAEIVDEILKELQKEQLM